MVLKFHYYLRKNSNIAIHGHKQPWLRSGTGQWTTYEDILSKHNDKIKGNNKEMNVDKVLDID